MVQSAPSGAQNGCDEAIIDVELGTATISTNDPIAFPPGIYVVKFIGTSGVDGMDMVIITITVNDPCDEAELSFVGAPF